MRPSTRTMFAAAILAGNLLVAPAAFAETVMLKADLKASNEVPPNDSTATGSAEATFDTVTKALFGHGHLFGPERSRHRRAYARPRRSGKNAGIMLPFNFVLSPIKMQATLTDAQAADLLAGKWYVNVHTEANPGGEIRGQLTK